MRYKECPYCGAALDPGERCDCQDKKKSQAFGKKRKKRAAPVRQHRSSKVEKVDTHISTVIVQNTREDCQA